MYECEQSDSEIDFTAFKKAEKKYKLYYDYNSKKKKKPRTVDLSEVVDFQSILESFNSSGELPVGISLIQSGFYRPVFCLDNHPGFYFIPGGISIEEQCHWIRESLFSFPQPPNRTNHNAIYGPISDLFIAARDKKVLVEDNISDQADDVNCNGYDSNLNGSRWNFYEQCDIPDGNLSKSVQAPLLLRKLRWTTLGLQFDWSKRNYNVSLPHKKIPESLSQLAKKLAAPAMPLGEEFQPEAAIVNYFASGDTLGGHLDDMEADWSKPIVSMSLGCKAIFLLGGKSRLDEPFAMFLRSGDVVLMAGEARECFHGVPRIFTDEENSEITELEERLSEEDDHCFMDYLRTSRINMNIRQVY